MSVADSSSSLTPPVMAPLSNVLLVISLSLIFESVMRLSVISPP